MDRRLGFHPSACGFEPCRRYRERSLPMSMRWKKVKKRKTKVKPDECIRMVRGRHSGKLGRLIAIKRDYCIVEVYWDYWLGRFGKVRHNDFVRADTNWKGGCIG